jgi:hypothetical protein
MTLGQHELTDEECSFVKTALIFKALERTNTALKAVSSRVEQMTLKRQDTHSWAYEGADSGNLQRLISSLSQSFDTLTKRLASAQSRS